MNVSKSKENTAPCKADTELCRAKAQTFYGVVDDNMVYITVTVQKLPKMVKGRETGRGHQSVKDFMKFISETIDLIDIGQLIV